MADRMSVQCETFESGSGNGSEEEIDERPDARSYLKYCERMRNGRTGCEWSGHAAVGPIGPKSPTQKTNATRPGCPTQKYAMHPPIHQQDEENDVGKRNGKSRHYRDNRQHLTTQGRGGQRNRDNRQPVTTRGRRKWNRHNFMKREGKRRENKTKDQQNNLTTFFSCVTKITNM